MLTDTQRRTIASRAQTLSERLSTRSADAPDASELNSAAGDQLDEWVEGWTDHYDKSAWRDRLDRLNDTESVARRRLAVEWPEGKSLPTWMTKLDGLTTAVAEWDEQTLPDHYDPETPFVHVLAPIVEYASGLVSWPDWVQSSAVRDFESTLLFRLRRLFLHPLFVDFKHDLQCRGADRDSGPADHHYRQFVAEWLDDGLASFFTEYAFLARLTATSISQWTDRIETLCERFETDREAIRDQIEIQAVSLTGVETLGDAHAEGQRVLGLQFNSGDRVAYKPRDISPEHWFDSLLGWVNDNGSLPTFRRVRSLPRDGYGWMEWVEQQECPDRTATDRFYRRMGALTGLLYALDFSDGHIENLLPAGEHPIVVDLETIAQPIVRRAQESDPVASTVRESVLSTGLIPTYFPESSIRNIAGLDTGRSVKTDAEVATVDRPNTDWMELRFRDEVEMDVTHLPSVDGETVPPEEATDELLSGFEAAYRLLLTEQESLLADDGPIDTLEDTSVRVLFRSTQDYDHVRRSIRESASLRTGVPFGIRVEQLAETFVEDDRRWPVFERERTALGRYDIPRFTVPGDSTEVCHDGESVTELGDETPVERVRARVEALSERDLAEQSNYLRLAFDSTSLSHAGSPAVAGLQSGRDIETTANQTARQLFNRICDASVETANGTRTWVTRDYRNTATGRGVNVGTVPPDLYSGRLGIALFGAALAVTTGDDRYRSFVENVVTPIEDELQRESPYPDLDIGGGSGVGALVYGFTKLAELLGDSRYWKAARRASRLVTDKRLESDDTFDVLRGSAGAVLGLLALDDADDVDVLSRAQAAGDRLLETAQPAAQVSGQNNTGSVWQTIQSDPLCGVSHGVGGIATALARLGERTSETQYVDAAREAIRFEDAAYDPSRENWPDWRAETSVNYERGWCAGRAGIGLTRLTLRDVPGLKSVAERDVGRALDNVEPRALSGRDHVCCGNFGRVEFLLAAGRTKQYPDRYVQHARRLADATVRRAERAGRFTVPWVTDEWTNSTFFGGDAGVGYTLLRLDNPDLPCVLQFE